MLRPWQAFYERHWSQWLSIRQRLRHSEATFHLLLAAAVGVVGGLANLLFYFAIEWVKVVTLHHSEDVVEVAMMLDPWARLATPALGGLAAGLVLFWGLRLVGKQGPTNLMEVVAAGDGRLPFRTTAITTFSSLVSIATGASIGREGSIIQLTAMIASKSGQVAGWQPYRLRLLLACGAAAGMAAAYNAPIAGAVFAAQVVLGNFSMNLFAPVIFSSVIAATVSRSFFGIEPWYHVPAFDFTQVGQLPWFLVLGAFAGLLGALFLKLLQGSEQLFNRTGLPIYGRLTLAGIVVGAVAVYYPEVWGNGYSVASAILQNHYGLAFLATLLLAKLVSTSVTVGAGTVGGVFTPTLFLGAAMGGVFGNVLHGANIAMTIPISAFALAGMGGMLAATTHSPLLAMIMVFEISLNYSIMPPLMLACATATLVARQFHHASIYTERLRQKGVLTGEDNAELGAATQQTVGDVMHAPVPPLNEAAGFREISERFLVSPNNFLPVVNDQKRLLGVVALQDLKAYLNIGDELPAVIAFDLMRPPPLYLTPNQGLQQALPMLLASEQRNIPVVNNPEEMRLIGSVSRNEALGLLSETITTRMTSKADLDGPETEPDPPATTQRQPAPAANASKTTP